MRVLGIETSCDETSAAVVEGDGGRASIRSLVILSQDVHSVFGGVVPEIASRVHLTALVPVVREALREADAELADIDAVAVTAAPGLVGALLVGVGYGKSVAYALGKPCIGVHHMEGHLFAVSLEDPTVQPPFTALLVSGGHTLLVDVEAWGHYRLLGQTRDDAAGEAFDKVAKLLGLPYPGGPALEQLAATVARSTHRFTKPMLRRDQRAGDPDYYDFSFSGLKTAVVNAVRAAEGGATLTDAARADIARAFQQTAVDTLAEKTARALDAYSRKRVVIGGGVACNRALIAALTRVAAERGATVHSPSARLATDNAAMIASAGLFHLNRNERASLDLSAHASQPLPGLLVA